ncbi:MmgE/PrpD family protein [Halovenus marina]|uniref:MmgE/PrpD family protein n=1 Tax=Halovenus marina TaxID=3396621 RepID=UPI003F575234
MDETEQLARFAAELDAASIPDDVLDRARVQIADTIGVALHTTTQPYGEQIRSYVDTAMSGDAVTVLGGGAASPTGGAFANGAFAHANDYDDTFESIIIHPSASVVPAAFAVAETTEADAETLLTGYVAGIETTFRVGHATYPGHYTNGWHSTGTIGSFGAAAAAATVFGFDTAELQRAFGVVASGSSALLRNAGTMMKPVHPAHAARMGVEAALLVREGITADEQILSGERGYGAVMTPDDSYDPEPITDGLGSEWAARDLGIKPYPCGRIMHAAMEELRELRQEQQLQAENVESIVVALDDAASDVMTYERPTDEFEARASIEFGLAAVLRAGDAGVDEFTTEYITDERTRAVMERVERDFEANLFGDGFGNYGAKLVVTTTEGERFERERRQIPGSPDDPLSESRRFEKFRNCAEGALDAEAIRQAYDAIVGLGGESDVDDVLALVSR